VRVRSGLLVTSCLAAIACTGKVGPSDQGGPRDLDGDGIVDPAPGSGAGPVQPGAMGPNGGAPNGMPIPGSASDPMLAAECAATADTGASVLRRLSRLEYRLTLQDLFQLPEPPAAEEVPEDAQQGGFRTVAALQNVSDQHQLAYLEVAERLGGELMADAARRARVIGCDSAASDCLARFVERFGRLAFRRPLAADEASGLVAAAQGGSSGGDDAYRFVIEALLTAPSFLFRVEVGEGAAPSTLSPVELASRLSFALSGRAPSAELLDRAIAGELATAEGVSSLATELLAAPQAREGFQSFFQQWLGFEQLRAPNVPPPGFTPELLPEMIGETERFLDELAWTPGSRFTDALRADFTYLTPRLGTFYGIPVQGTGFTRVAIPAGHARAGTGLLTQASIISSKTDADLISHRGAWLRAAFLCQKLAIPSDLQEEIQSSVAGLSYLEVIALRNRQQPCAGCHAQIDPIGVAFAQFDAIGHHDPKVDIGEYGLTPSIAGLSPPEFATLGELASKLAAQPAIGECMAQKLFVYVEGREPDASDRCALAAASRRFAESGGQFPAILAALVESPGFRLRRAQ
jgi:hypothetical protein